MLTELDVCIVESDERVAAQIRGHLQFLGLTVIDRPDDAHLIILGADSAAPETYSSQSYNSPGSAVVVGLRERVSAPDSAFEMMVSWPCTQPELAPALTAAVAAKFRRGNRSARTFRELVGVSSGINRVRDMMARVQDKDVTVLITGESGTGKEVVARALHEHSPRRDQPFVPVNCGAIPAELLESELLGHEKGSFTGAIAERIGRFELANGGTIFLDEIGDMPPLMQVKLLRVIQERCFERVGGSRTINVDVRIICATHRDLEQKISAGEFREDLYYRINVFPIEMPALRERIADLDPS